MLMILASFFKPFNSSYFFGKAVGSNSKVTYFWNTRVDK